MLDIIDITIGFIGIVVTVISIIVTVISIKQSNCINKNEHQKATAQVAKVVVAILISNY